MIIYTATAKWRNGIEKGSQVLELPEDAPPNLFVPSEHAVPPEGLQLKQPLFPPRVVPQQD